MIKKFCIFWALIVFATSADECVLVPPFGPGVVQESAVFYDAVDDLPDRAVSRRGRLVVPFEMAAGQREVVVPFHRQLMDRFERAKVVLEVEFEGDPLVENAIATVCVWPGLHSYGRPRFDLAVKPIVYGNGRMSFELDATEIAERAKLNGIVFPCNLEKIRLVRKAGAACVKGYLATIDLERRGLCEEFTCGNGRLLVVDLDRRERFQPKFVIRNNGTVCEGSLSWRLYDQSSNRTYREGRVDHAFARDEVLDVALPCPRKAGCWHVDYTFTRKGSYRYEHTVSFVTMYPAGKYPERFSDDFKFSCLSHHSFYSLNEVRRMAAYMREMGANYSRCGGKYWFHLQPEGPNQPFQGWKRYMKELDICLENGIEPDAAIIVAPAWAKDPSVTVRQLGHFPRYEPLEAYCMRFAGGLKGRVRYFEGNNEPNLARDWNAELEGRYENLVYRALKKARPDAIFLSGEWGGHAGSWDDAFYGKYNVHSYDVIAQHYHNSIHEAIACVSHLEVMMRRHGVTKPWFGDECANAYTNQHKQAREMFYKNIYSRGHGAIGMTWYNLRCKGCEKPLPFGELSYGMLTYDFCPREVYVAFNAYAKTFRQSRLVGDADLYPGVMSWRYERKNQNVALYPLWSMNQRYTKMTVRIPTDAKRVSSIDLLGNVFEVPLSNGCIDVVAEADPVTLRLEPMTARLGKGELVKAEEVPSYNRAVCTKSKPASFRAHMLEQYRPLYESSEENDDLVWRGPSDLSGFVFVFYPENGADFLRIRVVVDDDVHVTPYRGEKMCLGDGFELMLKVPEQRGIWRIGGAWYDEKDCACWVWEAPRGVDRSQAMKDIRVTAHRCMNVLEKSIWYHVDIPLKYFGMDAVSLREKGLGLNAVINDNDGRCREGYFTFTHGGPRDPENFATVEFQE